ncbi:hypothetical protein [Pontibacter akesuensis]|uniref:Uncharacterized protein n=1 Tax=Pontibacter akesuensis TaxID=388950 RepID=A0A1I7GKI5_9BACT|nr:hypothetical protein [Pontibacter akesuensis]GHA56273.1 hypothetical protein GCM10007389_04820 [Pontibacter akesuensis]SFU49002.1 hypothetical protein SAMN04487941_1093 [Pontibacter akesuensis]
MKNENRNQDTVAVNDGLTALTIISWLFGTVFFAIGVVNTFWGNDPGFGVFIVLLSLVYFLPVNDILRKTVGFPIPKLRLLKILVGLFILWAAMGVGELPDKVELMLHDLR